MTYFAYSKDRALWLADKITSYREYAKEASLVLRLQADEIERLRQRVNELEQENVRLMLASTEAMAELRKSQGEPVAWRYKIVPPSWTYSDKMPDKSFAGSCWDDWEVTPLYTSVPSIPEQVALTREIVKAATDRLAEGTFSVSDLIEVLEAALAAAPKYNTPK